jgi:hypothetical protein
VIARDRRDQLNPNRNELTLCAFPIPAMACDHGDVGDSTNFSRMRL